MGATATVLGTLAAGFGGLLALGLLAALASGTAWARRGRTLRDADDLPLVAPTRAEFGDASAMVRTATATRVATVVDLDARRDRGHRAAAA
ncbi:hypothetical protein ACFFKU_02275 [Kineococcus gynurae]|uniref:Uncharacterized protein n=1 Tax=Kineococcus gynurae TaxID=452979 RepID=A0ABV5LSQ2_9ACTN